MKTWEKILFYSVGLFLWLTDGIKKMSKKWKPAMAMLMAVVMLCGMLPATIFAVETPTITVTGLTAPQAGQSAEEWLDGISPVLSPDYEWADAEWYEGAFDNYADMMSNNEWGEFLWNFGSGQSYTLVLWLASETPTLPLNATPNVPGATSAVYKYSNEADNGWHFAYFMIVYTVGYEVSFDANGGTGTMIPAEVNEGEEYTLPECGFTAPSNKAFKAWSVGGEEKQPGDKITVSANTTVTAVWQDLVKYDLWVGGVQVTNASNITGEGITGAVSYDSTTKTLILNNATITGVHEFSIFDDVSGIYGKETLKINLIGNNTITGSDNGGSSYGIFIDNGNLTFTGTGSLTVSAADLSENNWSVAVFAEGTITVEESCTITAYCGTNAWIASAFKSYAGSNEYNLPNATGILVAGNKNAPEATNFEVCNGDPDEFQYLRIAPGYTVTLNKDGGTINSDNVTCYFVDTGATLPTEVTKANSIFGGWYDNAECTGTAITEIPVGSTGEKEYWAKWTTAHTCSIESVDKVWPDCENGGKEAYYKCEGCGKFFEDANGTTEIADIANWGNLPKNGHDYGTLKAAQPEIHTATELKAGVAAHYFCDECDTYFTEGKVATTLDALTGTVPSHNYATVNGYKGEDGHADACACGDKANTAAHKDENADGKCDVCAYNVGLPTTPDGGNKPSDTPQTGDNTQLGLWIALLIVSSFGIVAITLFGKKKYSVR